MIYSSPTTRFSLVDRLPQLIYHFLLGRDGAKKENKLVFARGQTQLPVILSAGIKFLRINLVNRASASKCVGKKCMP